MGVLARIPATDTTMGNQCVAGTRKQDAITTRQTKDYYRACTAHFVFENTAGD